MGMMYIMLGKNSGQLDIISQIMYDKLMQEKRLLIDIDRYVGFLFVYDVAKDKYSDIGRKSKDPLVILKMLLLEFLYVSSDHKIEDSARTDIVFICK